METISIFCCITNCTDSPFRIGRLHPIPLGRILLPKRGISVSASRTSSRPVAEVEEDDDLQTFLKDRAVNGDFVSKASDLLWREEVVKSIEDNASVEYFQEADQVMQSEYNAGFLKLPSTREWMSRESSPPPLNKKPTAQENDTVEDKVKESCYFRRPFGYFSVAGESIIVSDFQNLLYHQLYRLSISNLKTLSYSPPSNSAYQKGRLHFRLENKLSSSG